MCVAARGSSEQIGAASRLVTALANSVEPEQVKKPRSAQMRGYVPRHSGMTAGGRSVDSRKSKTEVSSTLPAETDCTCTVQPVIRESVATALPGDITTLPGDISDCQSRLEHTALTSSTALVSNIRMPPSSVKEYSLFDNHFSKAVENVLKNDICLSGGRCAFNGVSSLAMSYPTADEALLAKAPGYRASTASPCCNRFLAERPRKYSNDSSSSLSSVRSCEDSPSSATTGGHMLPPLHHPRLSHQLPDILHGSTFHPVHDLPPQIPACMPSPFPDFVCSTVDTAPDLVDDNVLAPTTVATDFVHYSSPNEPMTLPRISTDLNPYAPDFVFRPTSVQTPRVDSPSSTTVQPNPDTPDFTSTTSGDFFVPAEVMELTTADCGRWTEPVVGMADGGSLLVTTAFDIGTSGLFVDMPARQWTMPSTLLQESLTFG